MKQAGREISTGSITGSISVIFQPPQGCPDMTIRAWRGRAGPGQCPVLGGVCMAELSPQGWAGLWLNWQGPALGTGKQLLAGTAPGSRALGRQWGESVTNLGWDI